MFLATKRFSLFLLSCLTWLTINAQTLYWVGGSGNFNDPKHWSLSPGGAPSRIIPSNNSDIVFTDSEVDSEIKVVVDGKSYINSLIINGHGKINLTKNLNTARLIIRSRLENKSNNKNFDLQVITEFSNNFQNEYGYINTGTFNLNTNFVIRSGKWKVNQLNLNSVNWLSVLSADVDFSNASVEIGNLNLLNCNFLNFDNINLKVDNLIRINNSDQIKFNNSKINKKLYDSNYSNSENVSSIASKKGSSNQINTACFSYTTTLPSCSPGCDANVIISLPPANCYTPAAVTPYNVYVTTFGCPGTPTGTLGVMPGTYTLTNFCLCTYGLYVEDANGIPLEAESPAVQTPVVLTSPFSGGTTSISCNGECTGAINVNFSNGLAPYTLTVTPPGGAPQFTASSINGSYSLTNLCAGTLSISALGQGQCTNIFTRNFVQPPPLVANTVLANVSCNGFCNGLLSVSPSGGTPNYTVSFNPGSTFNNVVSGSTVSTAGLCPGVVSATLTDFKGCITTTSANITQPLTLTVTSTQSSLTCNGVCNGFATINISGGTAAYNVTVTPATGAPSTFTSASGNINLINLCGGVHTVDVRDNNNCLFTYTFNIAQPPGIIVIPTLTNVTCNGGCDGRVELSASGGSGSYTYTWTPNPPFGQSTATISSVCAGSFVATVRDASCPVNVTVTITEPPALTLTPVTQSASCFGICDGSSTVTTSGGNGGPFNYIWSPAPPSGQGTPIISNLCGGNSYIVSVTDASLCPIISAPISITQPSSITPNITTTNVTCNGNFNGAINASPTGAVIFNYTLASSTSTTTNSPPYLGLPADNYTLFIQNTASSCIESFTTDILEPTPLVPSVVTTNLLCFNQCIGTLSGSASGGTPTYTFTWITPTGPATGANLINQCAGNYVLTVRDVNNCTVTAAATVLEPPDLIGAITSISLTCFTPPCNGILQVTPFGGTPPYTYSWSAGATPTLSSISGLCAGNYNLLLTDDNGCAKTITAAIASPSAIVLGQTTLPVSCAGGSNGSSTVTASGGAGSFTFQFNTVPATVPIGTNTTGIISGLSAGNYVADVTDANGCLQSIPFTITSPPPLLATITGSQASCNACIGGATVAPSGGTSTYTFFAWTNSLGVTVSTLVTANALCAGDYTVVVTDNNSCTSTATVNIPQSIAITLGLSSASVQCFGGLTGSASAIPSGGTPAYNFTWSPGGQNTSSITGLSAGAYAVFVQDNLGCSTTSNINISEPPLLVVNATKTDATCFSSCNGLITTTVSGGTPIYAYSWSPGAEITASLTSVCSGTYALTVTDFNGCTQTLPTFTVNENPPLVVTFTITNPSNCSAVGADGSICATVSGGSGSGYTYTWSPVNSGLSCINSLTAGVYVLDATDGATCTVNASTMLINPGGPTLTTSSQSVTCFGGANGSATATATGGSGTFSFDWSPAVTFSTVVGNVTTVSGLTTGTYIVSSTDLVSGCVTASNVIITQPSSVTANAVIGDVTCNGSATGSINLVPSGGTSPYAYTWAAPVTSTNSSATGLFAGIYSVTVNDFNGCSTAFTFSVSEPPPLLLTNVATDVKCNTGCDGSIIATPSGGTPAYSYTWLPVGLFAGAIGTPSITGLCPNVYVLNVSDSKSCTVSNIITITEPTPLTSVLNLVQPACFTSTDAIASHLASGGTPTYAFSWSSSPATTSTLSILAGGNYVATVTDANGCTVNQPFTVTFPDLFTATLTATDPKCNASCDGSITTTLSGAQGLVTYSWLPVGVFGGASSQSLSSLCANDYTLVAIDGNSCQATANVILVDPPPLLANVSFADPLCNGDCNGTAISVPSNAIGTVNYTWSTVPTNTTPAVNNLCSGVITLTVQDGNLCLDVQTFTLVDPPVLTVAAAVIDANCTLADGSITITASGGTPLPSYSYTWSPPVSANNIANGVFAGVYSATVADGNNCTSSLSILVNNINGPTAAPVISSNVTCNGYFDGTAFVNTVTIVGGTPSYTVAWLAPIASSGNPATNLPAGNYNAQITDDNNCILITTVSISEPAPVVVSPTFILPSCNNSCDGIIDLNPSGGISPSFSYTWSTATTTIATLSSTLANACAGDYTIIISDNGCLSTQTLTLLPQTIILANIAITANVCFGDCNGSALITGVSGGVAPYQYSWSDGTTGVSMNNLCNGTYSLMVTDNNGCSNMFTVSITSNPQITAVTSSIEPTCNLCNGSSTITASGGTGGPYSYSWTNGSVIDQASNLCAGLYQVLITDLGSISGCQQLENIVINNSKGIRGENINIQSLPCNNTCTGAATVTAVGGTPPISYNWVNPAISNSVITNLCAGTYFLQMVDALGCIRSTSVVLSPVTTLSVSAFASAPSCGGAINGTITAIISGGTPTYNILWSPSGATTSILAGVAAGIYTITATESSTNACSISQQINLNTSASPTVVGSQTNINCFGACTGAISTAVSGSAAPFSYQWSTGGNAPSLTNLCSGVISLTVTDNNSCKSVQSFNITENTPILTGIPQIIQPSCGFCNGSSTINPIGGALPYTYTWTNGSTGLGATSLCAGIYNVVISDIVGCQQTETIVINNSNGITGETFSVQGLPCNNSCNGGATVTAVGGTAPYTYNWISPAVTGSVNTNLCAGTYFVQMIDNVGCIRTSSVDIVPAITLSLTPIITAPGCNQSNGAINLQVGGGVPAYTFSWQPVVNSTATVSSIPQGSYTVTVTESSANNCSITQQINVSNASAPSISYAQTNINCFNACTGVISTTASGAAPPFTYSWSVGGSASSITNLCNGVITLSATDANTCVAIQSFTITQNPLLQINVPLLNQPTCTQCNGSATISALGGSVPYSYAWTNGSTSPSTSSLCAGIFNVLITDNVGCQQTETIVINNSNGITGETFSVQGLPCSNSCNGGATVTAVGGTAPYTYNWISPAVTGSVNTNLCAGTYFVQMTDNVGCIRTSSVDIIPAITLSLTPIITTPGCAQSNGAINLQVSGGVPAYTFSWQPVANNTATLGSIQQGSYTVTVTESSPNNCSVTQQINVSNANAPSISYTQTNIDCFNACTGAVTAIASGTATPFVYNWSVGGSAPSITNLCNGLITLSATDNNSCVAIQSFTITQNPLLQIGVPLLNQPTCNQCNGSATISALGGVVPYSYTWTNGASASSTSSLCAGLYQVLITDDLNCQQTQNIVINNSSGITGELTNVQNESCALSCNGAATVTAVGGTSPISYNWINPPTSGATINNLCAGSYFVQMVDAQGCIRTTSVGINAAVQLSLAALVKSPSCGASDGSIAVVPSGGSGSYTFSWSPSGNTSSLTSLGVGAYSLTLSDAVNGCSIGQAFLLSNANGPVISYIQTNIDCFGTCTGFISTIATGTAPPYNFNWSTGSTTADATNLCQGIVTLTVASASNSCATLQSFTITESPELQLSLSNTIKPKCFNGCDGLVTLIPSGGSLPYTYGWSPTGETNPKSGLCAGIQSVVVTDAKGCKNSVTVTLNNPAPISVTATAINSSCNSVNDGSIDLLIAGGTPTYAFVWQGPSGYSASSQSISNVFAGNYSLTLSDVGGCTRDTVLSLVTTVTINALAGRDTSLCFGIDMTLDGSKSIGAVKYDWYRLPNTAIPIAITPSFVASGISNTATYILLTTSSVSGCVDRDTVMINIFPDTFIDAGPDLTIPVYSSVTIGGNPTTFGVASLSWTPSQYLNDPTLLNPIASNTVNTTFTVTIVDLNGCVLFDTMRVDLYPEIRITNGFSPNADGRNDTWIIDYIDQFPDCTVEIYNRWGEQLFYSTGYNVPFDGHYKGKELPVGTYYYIINLNYPTYPKPYTGPLTIFR